MTPLEAPPTILPYQSPRKPPRTCPPQGVVLTCLHIPSQATGKDFPAASPQPRQTMPRPQPAHNKTLPHQVPSWPHAPPSRRGPVGPAHTRLHPSSQGSARTAHNLCFVSPTTQPRRASPPFPAPPHLCSHLPSDPTCPPSSREGKVWWAQDSPVGATEPMSEGFFVCFFRFWGATTIGAQGSFQEGVGGPHFHNPKLATG